MSPGALIYIFGHVVTDETRCYGRSEVKRNLYSFRDKFGKIVRFKMLLRSVKGS